MKVKIKDVCEIEVKDISYGDARKIHRQNSIIFWGKTESEVNPEEYYELLEKVKVVAGIKDSDLKKYTMIEVDQILQTILMEYTGLNPKN